MKSYSTLRDPHVVNSQISESCVVDKLHHGITQEISRPGVQALRSIYLRSQCREPHTVLNHTDVFAESHGPFVPSIHSPNDSLRAIVVSIMRTVDRIEKLRLEPRSRHCVSSCPNACLT
eukprot:IDg12204t1